MKHYLRSEHVPSRVPTGGHTRSLCCTGGNGYFTRVIGGELVVIYGMFIRLHSAQGWYSFAREWVEELVYL